MRAFPGQFLTMLGPSFLRDLYRFYISEFSGIVLVAVTAEEKLVGSVLGGKLKLRSKFTARFVPKYILTILWRGLINNKVRKRLWQHFILLIKNLFQAQKKSEASDEPNCSETPASYCSLLSICTVPSFHNKGIGRMLLEAFCRESTKQGYGNVRLSVHSDNSAAIALYKRCGFKITLETPRGIYFEKDLKV
jgi:ribosomal protein S18 acetylase RimI-like enzyme